MQASKQYRKVCIVTTNCEKSAEAIVRKEFFSEGPNRRLEQLVAPQNRHVYLETMEKTKNKSWQS